MKIGIDISQIVYQGTGVANFTRGLVEAILKYDKNNSWTFLFYSLRQNLDPELEKKIFDSNHKLIKWKLPPTFVSVVSNNLHKITKLLTFNFKFLTSLDWFITSDWCEIPLDQVNKTTIVHDLVFKRFPETVNQKILRTQELRLNHVKREEKIIFCDSLTTKNDLIRYYQIKSERIIVNYPGVNLIKPTENQINQTLKKYKINKPFLLSVGKIEPRKNLSQLIDAFKKLNNHSLTLAIVGIQGWDTSVNQLIDTKEKNIKFLGFVNDQELYSLYSACVAFVFPSLWEGFGYPLVEAMNLNTPIICSDILPFREIAQNAALYFDVSNPQDLINKIKNIVSDNQLRKKLTENGKIRAKLFNWKNYYNILIKTLS